MTHQLADALVDQWKQRGWARNTVTVLRNTLKGLLRYLEDVSGRRDLANHLKRVPGYQARRVLVSVEEERRVMEVAPPWLQLMVQLCLCTALRKSEVLRFSPSHYDRERRVIRNLRIKNSTQHSLNVPEELAARLAAIECDPTDTRSFVEIVFGKPLSRSNLYDHWRKTKKKAGLPVGPGTFAFHDMRRTIATDLFNSTKDIVKCKHLLGHSNISTTSHYLVHADQELLGPVLEEARRQRFQIIKMRAPKKENAG